MQCFFKFFLTGGDLNSNKNIVSQTISLNLTGF